jgi:hypothetical protein
MDNIIEPTIDYDFSNLYLGPPSTLAGGSYFTKIMYSNNKLLYLQTPKCLTKQGFVKSGKKIFVDLMFDNNDTVFINWIENLEAKCQELLFSKGETWFQTKLEKDDIETAFTSAFKIFKSGKYYLLRVNVKPSIKIYNESNNVVSLEDITVDKTIISILEIQGIKFTSRSFQMEIELKQSLIVSPDPFLDSCFIKNPVQNSNQGHSNTVQNSNPTQNSNPVKVLETKDNLEDFIKDSVNEINKANPIPNSLESILEKEKDKDKDKTKEVDFVVDDFATNINDRNEHINEDIDENISLEIEDLDIDNTILNDDPNLLKEVDLKPSSLNNLDTIKLKTPNQVYDDILKKAREKVKEAKKAAVTAYLELKAIKKTYMIEDMDDSDSEFDNYSDNETD